MQYKSYKVEDFLFDEFFVKWVKNPGPETEHFWHSWIEHHPEQIKVINQARDIVLSIEPKHKFDPSSKTYEDVLENILKQPSRLSRIGYYKKNDRLTSLVKYAAVIMVFLTLGALIAFLNLNQVGSLDQVIMIEKVNPYGQKSTFELSDGTLVKLNAGSKLRYPETFGEAERKVTLEGEAFFKVSRDENKPFKVETKELTTVVLGTSFNVKSYQDESKTSVAVRSGKVKVMKSNEVEISASVLILEKDQMVSFDANNSVLIRKESVPESEMAWVDNTILFEHTEFEQVKHTLSRWYGVEFDILNTTDFEGGFNGRYTEETLDNVLRGLKDEGQYNFNYKIEGKKVTIY